MTRAKDISKIVTDADLSGTLDVTGDLTVDTNTLHVDSTNSRVGVGTASPSRDFQVDSTNNRVAKLHHTDGDYSFIVFEDNNTSDDGQVRIGALGNNCLLYSGGSEAMRINSAGSVSIGTSSSPNNAPLLIKCATDDNIRISQQTHASIQAVNDAASAFTELKLDGSTLLLNTQSSGNVGIGTDSPSGKFQVDGGRSYFSANSDAFALYLRYNTSTAGVFVGSPSTDTFTVSRSGGQEHLRIDSSGRVMIGTTTEGESSADDLTVAGSANTGITIRAGASNSSSIYMSDDTSGAGEYAGYIAYSHSANSMAFGVSSGQKLLIDSDGNVGIGGTPSNRLDIFGDTAGINIRDTSAYSAGTGPSINFVGLDNNEATKTFGIIKGLSVSTDNGLLTFTTRNSGTLTERMRIDSSGNVGIGNSSPLGILSTLSNDNGLVFQTSSSSNKRVQMFFKDNGGTNTARIGNDISAGNTSQLQFIAGSGSTPQVTLSSSGDFFVPRVYVNTTGGSANVLVASNGQFLRSTSSQRYKNTINDATHGLTELLTLRPVTYKGNNDGDTVFGGLIAEEVHDAGLIEFVDYDEENRPDALRYSNMVSLCIKAIQELKAELDSAKARITALENGE